MSQKPQSETQNTEQRSDTMSASAFADSNAPTVQFALDLLAKQKHIAPRKIRRWTQDTYRACGLFGVTPDKLIANPANLNPRFRRLSRGKHKIGTQRISNIRNSVKHVLSFLPEHNGNSFKAEMSPGCAAVRAVIPNKYWETSIRCILYYCSAQSILPPDFGDVECAKMLDALNAERLNGNPVVIHQNATRNWRRLGKAFPELQLQQVFSPRQTVSILPWTAFPAWVEKVCRAFIDRSTTSDAFDLSKPMKKWRPRTVETYLKLLQRYFSMLQHAGFDLAAAGDFRDVVVYGVVELGLRWLLSNSKKKRGQVTAANIATLLSQIAKNPEMKSQLSADEKLANEVLANQLSELSTRLFSEKGLSGQTHGRLAPLKEETNLAKLFLLAFGIEREIKKSKRAGRRLALLVQWALVLMVLTFCPLRISTICRLQDHHLVWSRPNRRGDLSLILEGDMLKNGEPQTIPLPKEVDRLLKLYLDDYRHLLVTGDTTFLFPGAHAGRSKLPGVMSTQISRLIRDRLPFEVNPHLFRHLVHLVILKKFPGAYIMISRVLTHRSLQTAVTNYSYFDVELSMTAFHQLVREVQNGTSSQKSASLSDIAYNQSEFKNGSR